MSVGHTIDQEPVRMLALRGSMPSGLYRLIAFHFWDALAFSGSRLLLILYLLDVLVHPDKAGRIWGLAAVKVWGGARLGLRSDQAFISAIFGLFGALAFVTPIIGGWLSDRFVSRRSAVIAGSLLLAAGHAMLALQAPFLLGLACLAGGNGFYRGAIGSLLAGLFERDDLRLAGGFQLFYAAANIAGIVSPLVCGTLGELVGWSWGFGAAAVAMLLGLATFLSIPLALLAGGLAEPVSSRSRPPAPIAPRLVLIAGVALFMIGNEQLGNAMVVWMKGSVDRGFGTITVPLTWFFSIGPLAGFAGTLLLARRRLGDNVPGMRRRMVSGCLLGGGSWALLALAATAGRVPAILPMAFLLIWGFAFALVLPSGAALMAALTPDAARGRWLGLYGLVIMIADVAVGWLGGLYGKMSHPAFICCHAVIIMIGGGLLASLARRNRVSSLR